MRWLVIAFAACGGGSAHPIDAAVDVAQPPDIDGMDVVVSSTGVVVWLGLTGELANNGRFAAPGTCGGTDDAIVIAPSCFGGIDIDNQTLDPTLGGPTVTNPYNTTHATTASSMLSASDCGHRIEIPLHAGPFATATNVAGTRTGQDIVVSWTTTAPFAIASVQTITAGFDCNDAGASQHRFANTNFPTTMRAGVQALSAPERTQTDLGEVRVWYGDGTTITIP